MPTSDVSLPKIFRNSRTIAFVGLSDKTIKAAIDEESASRQALNKFLQDLDLS